LLGAPPERVAVVPGGVEPSFRPIDDPAALRDVRRRYDLGEAPFILTVGVIEPRKNHRLLFEAYRLLRQQRDLPHRLVVVGRKGWLWEEILEVAESSPYRDDIKLVGFVADEDMPALYSAATAFALPSLYEGFGLPPLEAMACGTPVVVSNTSSLPEVVGDAGLLVEPTDAAALAAALELLLLDEPLRADLRVRALARAATFTWPAAAARLLAVYAQLGGRSGSQPRPTRPNDGSRD
jgi:glycosyltransferase involved in cell wall biosynthesis